MTVGGGASALARACGFDGVDFRGDLYVGAIQAEPSPTHNVDFTVDDLDSQSAWLRAASAENVAHDQAMRQLQDAMREKGAMVGGGGDGMPGGAGEGFAWTQTDDEVELSVDVPPGTKARDAWLDRSGRCRTATSPKFDVNWTASSPESPNEKISLNTNMFSHAAKSNL